MQETFSNLNNIFSMTSLQTQSWVSEARKHNTTSQLRAASKFLLFIKAKRTHGLTL